MKNIRDIILFLLVAGGMAGYFYFKKEPVEKVVIKKEIKKRVLTREEQIYVGHPLCIVPDTEDEKKIGYNFLVLIKSDNTIFIWEAKNYRPITNLPTDPDKTGTIEINEKEVVITVTENDGSVSERKGTIIKYIDENNHMADIDNVEEVVFTNADGNKKTLRHSYCGAKL